MTTFGQCRKQGQVCRRCQYQTHNKELSSEANAIGEVIEPQQSLVES